MNTVAPLRLPAASLPKPPGAPAEVVLTPADSWGADTLAELDQRIFGPQEAWPRAAFASYLQQAGIVASVAVLAGHPVGYVLARVQGDVAHAGNVDSMGVVPEARGHRVGDTLMRHALQAVEGQGVRKCTLQVREDNDPALGLYSRLGFLSDGRLPDYYGPGQDGLQMSAPLGTEVRS